jgi:hypothetical protein
MVSQLPTAPTSPHPAFFRAHLTIFHELYGPYIVPNVEQKRLQGALTYAPQAVQEQPILLIDDSFGGGGKAGIYKGIFLE